MRYNFYELDVRFAIVLPQWIDMKLDEDGEMWMVLPGGEVHYHNLHSATCEAASYELREMNENC